MPNKQLDSKTTPMAQQYHEHQHYEPYSNDRKFMQREGDPCRHCLYPFHEHHNGQCPKDEESDDDQT